MPHRASLLKLWTDKIYKGGGYVFWHKNLANSLRRDGDVLVCLTIEQIWASHFKSLVSVTPKSLVSVVIILFGIGVINDDFDVRKLKLLI